MQFPGVMPARLLATITLSLGALWLSGCETGASQEQEPIGSGPAPVEVERERPVEQVDEEGRIQPLANPPTVGDTEASRLKNHHRDFASQINADNVNRLERAWMVETKEEVSHRPLVAEGRVYFADWGGNVWAVELDSGKTVWKKKVQAKVKKKWPWYGFAGTGTIAGDKLIEASVEGMAYGIDRNTGEVIWTTDIAKDEHAGSLATLLEYDGLVYIGLQSVEEALTKMKKNFKPNFRGKVMALEVDSGDVVWQRELVEPPHNGVAVWSGFALDPETNALYFTTGNNYTGEATEMSDALVAVDAKTGEVSWHRQVTQHDVWTMAEPKGPDYDFGAAPQLFEATIDGKQRQLVGAGQKSGIFYVWDRRTGEPVWNVTVGYGHIGGGIHGEASIGTDRVFVWGNNAFPYKNPKKHPMDIKAVDIATGKLLWAQPKAQPAVQIAAGMLVNDVYLVPSMTGMVGAYRAQDGERVWTTKGHGPIASSLTVHEGHLLWGNGVPPKHGGSKGPFGVVAFSLEN